MARCVSPFGRMKAKIKHSSIEDAQTHADELNKREAEMDYDYIRHFTVYECDQCGFYHVGSKDRPRLNFDDNRMGCHCDGSCSGG